MGQCNSSAATFADRSNTNCKQPILIITSNFQISSQQSDCLNQIISRTLTAREFGLVFGFSSLCKRKAYWKEVGMEVGFQVRLFIINLTIKRAGSNPNSVTYLLCEIRKAPLPFWVSVFMTKLMWLISKCLSDFRILWLYYKLLYIINIKIFS